MMCPMYLGYEGPPGGLQKCHAAVTGNVGTVCVFLFESDVKVK